MKTKILIAVTTIGCLLAVGCRKDHECTYSHPNRAPKYIGDTPLTVLEIAENYFQLAEGDTLILSGYVNSISQNPHQVHPNYEWISMLGVSDMKNYVDPCWGYSVEGQNQLAALYKEEWNKESHYILLDELRIWVAIIDTLSEAEMESIKNAKCTITGIISHTHVSHETMPRCQEYCFLKKTGEIVLQ